MNDVKLLEELIYLAKKQYTAIGYEKLTIDGTVKSLTLPDDAIYADIKLESSITSAAIRYRIDGGTPSTTDGMVMITLDQIDVATRENLRRFKATQVAAGTHTLHITYYK